MILDERVFDDIPKVEETMRDIKKAGYQPYEKMLELKSILMKRVRIFFDG